MRKLKLYLDTSVISHLDAPDTPDKMNETLTLWDKIIQGQYDALISDIAIEEINKCDEPKKSGLYKYLSQIESLNAIETIESIDLAEKYIRYGVLKEKSRDDCRHISLATIMDADYIVSWNFKHFVNVKTINSVQAVNMLFGYKEVKIISPSMLLGGDDNDEE